MKQIFSLLIAAGMLFGFTLVQAQGLKTENSIDISKKANKGYLGNVVVDDARQQVDMVFVTRSTNKKVKFHVYQFDYNLKLLNDFEDEQEASGAKSKYKWFNYRGEDEYTVTGVTAEMNLTGVAVFKKKEISYSYNWFTGRYKKKEKITDKLKPKTEDGKGMYFKSSFQLDQEGQVMALVSYKPDKMRDFHVPYVNYGILRIDADLNYKSDVKLDFDKAVVPLWSGPIWDDGMDEDEGATGDWAMIFVPFSMAGLKDYVDDVPNHYTYVRVGRDGQIKDRIEFQSKSHSWKIDGCYEKNGSVYLYGPGKNSKLEKTYFKMGDAPQVAVKGFECFQIMGIKDGKVAFLNAPTMDDFEAKNAKPSSQKKPVVYNGKKLSLTGITVTSSGEIFLNGQEFSYDAAGEVRGTRYQDFIIFHFDKAGNLVKQYGFDNPQKTGLKGAADGNTDPKFYPTNATIIEGSDGKSIYWMAYYIGKIDKMVEKSYSGNTEYTYTWYEPRTQARIVKIDKSSGSISEPTTLGGEDNYLFKTNPSAAINGGKQMILMGENPKEKKIWLGLFDPSTF